MMRRPAIQWVMLTFAVALYIYLAIVGMWGQLNNNDFKHIYFGMKALLDGSSPYPIQSLHHQAALQGYRNLPFNPYVYLPFTGQAMSFLAPFRLDKAVILWFMLNHLFVAGSVTIISKLFDKWRVGAAALLTLAFALNVTLYRTLSAGQLNLALLFLICLSWRSMRRDRQSSSGVIMAFAGLYKLMPGLYGFYYLLRQKWRGLGAMVLATVVLLAGSIAIAGVQRYAEFFPVLRQMGYGKSTWPWAFSFWDDPANQSLNSFFSHIFTTNDHTTPWVILGQRTANLATIGCVLLLVAAYVIIAWRTRPVHSSTQFTSADEGMWCATLILALLIPSLMWDHYLIMLILPAAWMISVCVRRRRILAGLIIIACMATTAIPFQFAAPQWRHGPGIILMSIKLWPTLILFGLNLCCTVWEWKNLPRTSQAENIHLKS